MNILKFVRKLFEGKTPEGGDTESRSFLMKEGKVTKHVEDFSAL
jgi:hypothetical protein